MRREIESAQHLARALDLPFIDLVACPISPGILAKLPKATTAAERCVPVVYNRRRVVLAVDDPTRIAWLEARGHELGLPRGAVLEFALTFSAALDRELERRAALPR